MGKNRGRVLTQADLGSTIHGQVTGVLREGSQNSAPMCHETARQPQLAVTATRKEWVDRLTQGFLNYSLTFFPIPLASGSTLHRNLREQGGMAGALQNVCAVLTDSAAQFRASPHDRYSFECPRPASSLPTRGC